MGCRGASRAPTVAESSFSCCTQLTYVQDQVCFNINIVPDTDPVSQVLYRFNVNPNNLYVSGTILISTAPAGSTLTVDFLLGGPGGSSVATETITPGTALAFTQTGFDTITLTVTTATAITPNVTGEICVTPRYPLGG